MNLSETSFNSAQLRHAVSAAVICAITFALSGCGIPGYRNAQTGRDLPITFRGESSEENSSQLGIDEFFTDSTLTRLIAEGLVGNQQLRILAEDIAIAENDVLRKRGAYLPFVTVGGGANLTRFSYWTVPGADNVLDTTPSGGRFPSPLPNFLMAANLSWQIDIWRQLRNARDAATLRFLGTTEGRNYMITRLVADIAENYYGLMALDKRLENLDRIIELQERSLEIAKSRKEGARGTELPVQRFIAEVRKNQSEKLIIRQEIIETENKINFLVGRFPMPVERFSQGFIELTLHQLDVGLPSQLLLNRPDIRQAELELAATGLDVKVARANFYPRVMINSSVGYEAFNTRYLILTPESLAWNVAGDIVAPLINKNAIKADYGNANAQQLQAVYNYQRTVLTAFTEVINRVSMVENFGKSIEIKKQQLSALEASVEAASKLFFQARAEYIDVLFAQRDLMDARMVLIDTKRQQLSAVVNTYQALGGGARGMVNVFDAEPTPIEPPPENLVSPEPISTDAPAGNAAVPPEPKP